MGTFANRAGRNIRNTNDEARATTMTTSDATTRTMTALAGLLGVALATALATAAFAQQGAPSATGGEAAAPAAVSPAEAGMRVNIDPATGRLLDTPAADPAARRTVQRAPLQEQDGATPEGGKMVVLDDRFHSEMRVDVPKDGKPTTDCAPAPAR